MKRITLALFAASIALLLATFSPTWSVQPTVKDSTEGGTTRPSPPPDETRQADENDIRETVFRYLFERNESAGQSNVDYYFLSFGNRKSPPKEFIDRFREHTPKVLPVSASEVSKGGGVSHKERGERGLIFRIEGIRWISDDSVEVKCGYYEGGLSDSGNTYQVERRNGKWVVTDDKMNWGSATMEARHDQTVHRVSRRIRVRVGSVGE
jgi:hypothetical protein